MILAIGGATATGKSSLAVEVAKRYNGEIVSADSMQIYKGMDIGTAKITEEEKGGIPHYLIDIISPKESYNVAKFVEDAERAIADIERRGKLPIVVGGTGLYIRSLLYNYTMGSFDQDLREKLNKEYAENGKEHMWEKLHFLDPEGAKKIHCNNVKRVLRALEVFLLTGKSISQEERAESKPHALFCLTAERDVLYERIERRVDEMFERGLQSEVERLLNEGVDFGYQSMQAIGYKEFKEYYAGNKTIEDVVGDIKINTRHYAKRQETWFKGMPSEWHKIEDSYKIIDKIEQLITK